MCNIIIKTNCNIIVKKAGQVFVLFFFNKVSLINYVIYNFFRVFYGDIPG